ncbi:DUF4190 domain-containing protein [Microbacterium sp. 1P10UB]|uniref:DUF4190 domain-containing protein n=1 Tax=unclassified Microbacterium TaxID=2609290 RepID=UPI0039A1A648
MTPPMSEAASPPTAAPRPGRTLGIVAFVLSFFVQPIALVLGIVALVQSRRAGEKNGFAVAAIIVSVVLMIVAVVVIVALTTLAAQSVLQACSDNGFTGTVTVWGQDVTCRDSMR